MHRSVIDGPTVHRLSVQGRSASRKRVPRCPLRWLLIKNDMLKGDAGEIYASLLPRYFSFIGKGCAQCINTGGTKTHLSLWGTSSPKEDRRSSHQKCRRVLVEYPHALSDIVMRSRIFSYILHFLCKTLCQSEKACDTKTVKDWEEMFHVGNIWGGGGHTTNMQETTYLMPENCTIVPLRVQHLVGHLPYLLIKGAYWVIIQYFPLRYSAMKLLGVNNVQKCPFEDTAPLISYCIHLKGKCFGSFVLNCLQDILPDAWLILYIPSLSKA